MVVVVQSSSVMRQINYQADLRRRTTFGGHQQVRYSVSGENGWPRRVQTRTHYFSLVTEPIKRCTGMLWGYGTLWATVQLCKR
jgi:hypothetical protein